MQSLFEGSDYGAGEGELSLEFRRHYAGLNNALGRVGECSAKFAEQGDGFLQDRQFFDREWRIGGDMSAHESGDVPRGSNASMTGSLVDGAQVIRSEPYRDSVGGG